MTLLFLHTHPHILPWQSTHDLYTINTLSSRVDPIQVNVTINGKELVMELDTGASVSIISEKTFDDVLRGTITLQPSKVSLTSYSGHELKVIGQADNLSITSCYSTSCRG